MISRLAVGDTSRKPLVDVFKVERDMVQDERMSEELPFGSRGGIAVNYQFPVDGEYLIKTRAQAPALRLHRRHGRTAPGGHPPRWRPAEAFHHRRRRQRDDDAGKFRRQHPRRSRVGQIHADGRSRPRSAGARKSRPARRRRLVRQTSVGGRRHSAAAANRVRPDDERAVFRIPGTENRFGRRPVQRHRSWRVADAACPLHLHAERQRGGGAVREENPDRQSRRGAYRDAPSQTRK